MPASYFADGVANPTTYFSNATNNVSIAKAVTRRLKTTANCLSRVNETIHDFTCGMKYTVDYIANSISHNAELVVKVVVKVVTNLAKHT